jgi:hypothetical protein
MAGLTLLEEHLHLGVDFVETAAEVEWVAHASMDEDVLSDLTDGGQRTQPVAKLRAFGESLPARLD